MVLVPGTRCKGRARFVYLYSAVMRRAGHLAPLLLASAIALAGCVSENRPADCEASETTIELTVSASSLEPSDPAACRGQLAALVIDSEVDGVFHIHGLDALLPATTIAAGEEITLEFEATISGQFPIELHGADDPQGVTVGIFTVHEP
jgi:hypothetical protein